MHLYKYATWASEAKTERKWRRLNVDFQVGADSGSIVSKSQSDGLKTATQSWNQYIALRSLRWEMDFIAHEEFSIERKRYSKKKQSSSGLKAWLTSLTVSQCRKSDLVWADAHESSRLTETPICRYVELFLSLHINSGADVQNSNSGGNSAAAHRQWNHPRRDTALYWHTDQGEAITSVYHK